MATNKPVEVDQLFGGLTPSETDSMWFVVHTKPRQEKKLAHYCLRIAISYFLPLQSSTKVYQRRKVTFQKPLFSGYVFLRCTPKQQVLLFRSGNIVRFLKVHDEAELLLDLNNIYQSTSQDRPIERHPYMEDGYRVKIIKGPYKDVEGIVVDSENPNKVIVGIHMIQQAICVEVTPDDIKRLKN